MLEILEKYKNDGWVMNQRHPTLPLTIWNYTQATQFERFWDDITIQCRGLVTDDTGQIVARPFDKFWNMEEERHISTEEFEVFTKMDGSLIILFRYNNEWISASRGSFISDQSVKSREFFGKMDLSKLDKNNTYIFEIIY